MSFILDALKKSESERNRQTGPVLMDVRIAAPRRRLPAWIWVIGAVLLANLVVLGYLMLRKQPNVPPPPVAQIVPSAAAISAPGAVIAAPAVTMPAIPPPVTVVPAGTEPVTTSTLPPAGTVVGPLEPQAPTAAAPTAITRGNDAELPTAQDLAIAGITLPTLQLNLHVYDTNPANRYVLLNSKRLHEGDYTAEGIKLERITAAGVVLESNGRRFRLNAGG
jgi:general secretion pathway protein B